MADPISFDPFLGWVDITDPNNIPEDARTISASDLLRYENFGKDAAAKINALSAGGGGITPPGLAAGSTAGDAALRPLIGARVGTAGVTTVPDSEYFDELHNLETAMGATTDITNWYRAVGTTSAADFTSTVVPELAANPNRKILYVLEIDKSNAQFNREFAAKDGIYPYLLATLTAIKSSGYSDRVYLAPFHEGNGGGGAAGTIGAYDWQMYDTNVAQLVTPSAADWKTSAGAPYGSSIRVNTPAQYKTAFRNVVTLARSLGLQSKIVQWFLAANTSDSLTVDGINRMDMAPGFAGDDFVDIVGLSYYNRSGDSRYSATWPQPGANGLREFYNAFQLVSGRPLWLCETGCATSNQYGDKGQWYSDLIKLVASDELPRVQGLVMFMRDTRKYGTNGSVTQGMDMRLENDAQKKQVGRAINAAKRPTKVNAVPQVSRNLLPVAVADLTTTAGWTASDGVTLAVGNQYTPDRDITTNGMRVTKPAFTAGDTKTSYTIYRKVPKANFDYVPNDPYVLTFTARASYDGFRIEAGIRQDGGAATSLGDELVLSSVYEQYVVAFSSITDDAALTGWRVPNFSFGNNSGGAAAWFEISDLKLARGTAPQPSVERLSRPRVRPMSGTANLTWNCETSNIYTATLTQNATLMTPTGVPFDGQEITLRLTQDATGGRSLNLQAGYYSASVNPAIAAGPNAKTLLTFQYDGDGSRWGLVRTAPWLLS